MQARNLPTSHNFAIEGHSIAGDLVIYAREAFVLFVTALHVAEWRGWVSSGDGPSMLVQLLNFKNQLELLLQQKFADICLQFILVGDFWGRIASHAGSPRERRRGC